MAGWPPQINAAFTWFFTIRNNTGALVSGAASLDAEVSIDGGTFNDITATEVNEGQGFYSVALTAAEMNGNVLSLICKTTTSNAKAAATIIYTSARQIDDLAFPNTSGRSIQVETDGMIHADVKEWLAVAPLALVSQRVNSSVGAMAGNVLTDAAINAAAFTAAKFAANSLDAVWATATRVLTASTNFNDPTAAAVADAVWDEDIVAAHGASDAAGRAIRTLDSISDRTNNANLNDLLGVVDAAGRDTPEQVWLEAVRVLTANTNLNDPTVAAIADAIWDEAVAGHVAGGSFGNEVQAHALSSEITALNDPTAAVVADAVWDEARAGHVAAGSFGQGVASVQGNVTGSVGSVTGAVASVTAIVTANMTQIAGQATAANRLQRSADTMVIGTVDTAILTPTTVLFEADDVTEATADHFNSRSIYWVSGALADQKTDITDYALVGSNGRFTVVAMTEAPANNDVFLIV